MSFAAADVLMVGTSAVSASCCVAPATRASKLARGLAVAMAALMTGFILPISPGLLYGGTAVVALLALGVAGFAVGGAEGRTTDIHRALGAGLMVVAVALHLHIQDSISAMPGMGGMEGHGHTGHALPATPGHDVVIQYLLLGAVAAYLAWTSWIVFRERGELLRRLLGWEHLTMAASVAVMVVAM